MIKPTRPVPRCNAAGLFHGRYKVEPEDFVVEEIPLYQLDGSGEHVYLHVEKRAVSTLHLLDDLSEQLRLDPRSIGVAGLKDAQAVSRQWVSVQGVTDEEAARLSGRSWRVLEARRHGNKLKMGHLAGNRFELVLRDTAPGDLAKARAGLEQMTRLGVPNYFGEQRFGKRGANLEKGLQILSEEGSRIGRRIPRRVFSLLVSAVQSEVFNRIVVRRLQGLGTLWHGDLAWIHRNGAVFVVEDPVREQKRADALEVSPSGPMPGPKMAMPLGDMRSLEAAVMAELGLTPQSFARVPFGLARGDRRPLRVPLWDASAEEAPGLGLRLRFGLPKGSYATAVLRELLVDTIWFGPGTEAAEEPDSAAGAGAD
ncbi:MAG: tRNA pseudouridine 13 synthase [Planctomycetota bacterium]